MMALGLAMYALVCLALADKRAAVVRCRASQKRMALALAKWLPAAGTGCDRVVVSGFRGLPERVSP